MEKVKRFIPVLMVLVLLLLAVPLAARADDQEALQRATDSAIAKIADGLGKRNVADVKTVAVVPLRGDEGDYATSGLRSATTKSSYGVFTRDDPTWDMLLGEIEWGTRREDVMDPATVQKFGKIAGVDAILYGRVWGSRINMWGLRAETKLTVTLADVETGQELWSSGPVTGEAYIHWSDALVQFWRYPLVLIGVIVGLAIIIALLRAIKHALRPL
ncbi:MAG TPA: hypothetical protein VM223_20380 [Planctomycetota bacterium]|nr:hypothetical protein [Planctomycetota bacterium]